MHFYLDPGLGERWGGHSFFKGVCVLHRFLIEGSGEWIFFFFGGGEGTHFFRGGVCHTGF